MRVAGASGFGVFTAIQPDRVGGYGADLIRFHRQGIDPFRGRVIGIHSIGLDLGRPHAVSQHENQVARSSAGRWCAGVAGGQEECGRDDCGQGREKGPEQVLHGVTGPLFIATAVHR